MRFNFAGSQQLALQLEQGARADVFASADQRWMDYVLEHKLIEGEPRVFAHNVLVVIVPKTNPGRIRKLEDLAQRGVKLVVGAEAVPVGKYTREVIENLADQPGFPPAVFREGARQRGLPGGEREVGRRQGAARRGRRRRSCTGPTSRREVSRYLTVLEIPEGRECPRQLSDRGRGGRRYGRRAVLHGSGDRAPKGKRVLARHGLMPAGSTP